jgi:V-type H+-transporting ATPase subunit H
MLEISLVHIMKHSPGPQMSYQVAFCLWLLSFEQDVSEQINKSVLYHTLVVIALTLGCRKYDIIPLLVNVAQAAVKEKVIRVIVATFRVAYEP